MKTARIALAGSLVSRTSSFTGTRDQMFQNCFSYQIADPITGGSRIVTRKRQGFGLVNAPTGVTNATEGACIWYGNTQYPVFSFIKTGGTTCGVYLYDGTQVGGDIANVTTCRYLADIMISGTTNLYGTFTDSGTGAVELWYYPNGGAWTQVTDSDFPSALVTTATDMDGYVFVLTNTGQLWNSDLNSISAWSANNRIDASLNPDGAYGLARSKKNIVVFGKSSIEFFRNNGNPSGSPLVGIPEAAKMIGMRNGTISPFVIGDDIYFTGVLGPTSGSGAFKISGLETIKISTPEVDKLMQSGAFSCMGCANFGGYQQILFQNTLSDGQILVYQPDNNRWWKFYPYNSSATSTMAIKRLLGLQSGGVTYAAGSTVLLSSNSLSPVFSDYSAGDVASFSYEAIIQTQAMTMGTSNRKFWRYIRLRGEKQASTANVTVSYSDDDAVNFTTAGTIDMSSSSIPAIFNLGSSRSRVWKFVTSANLGVEFDELEIGYEVGLT